MTMLSRDVRKSLSPRLKRRNAKPFAVCTGIIGGIATVVLLRDIRIMGSSVIYLVVAILSFMTIVTTLFSARNGKLSPRRAMVISLLSAVVVLLMLRVFWREIGS